MPQASQSTESGVTWHAETHTLVIEVFSFIGLLEGLKNSSLLGLLAPLFLLGVDATFNTDHAG